MNLNIPSNTIITQLQRGVKVSLSISQNVVADIFN